MKKFIYLLTAAILMASCNSIKIKDEGRNNAEDYIRQHLTCPPSDIDKIEATSIDTLLSDSYAVHQRLKFAKASESYRHLALTNEKYLDIISHSADIYDHVRNSWLYGPAVNDTLHSLHPEYKNSWRKVYTVVVTMKNGATPTYQVMMESDGITPVCEKQELLSRLESWSRELTDAISQCF